MKTTTFIVTTELTFEHDDFAVVDPLAITEAANAGAQAMADEAATINSVKVKGKNRLPQRVQATPKNVLTRIDGHWHELNLRPWSNDFVRPEEAIGQRS